MRDSLSRCTFATVSGCCFLFSGLWLYCTKGAGVFDLRSVQAAIVAGSVLCVGIGLFFLVSAYTQAKGWNDPVSLPRLSLLLASGTALLTFAVWFYSTQTVILGRESQEWADRRDTIRDQADKNKTPRELAQEGKNPFLNKPSNTPGIERPIAHYRVKGERINEWEYSQLQLQRIPRDSIIVSLGSGVCASLGLMFVVLSLRMWSGANQKGQRQSNELHKAHTLENKNLIPKTREPDGYGSAESERKSV